ncbi:MAG: single-stranded-DNA-specific exonuclease RecJ [Candidatus Kapabacteria bacterium]|nr:single-stranded-DNA-specific exonuclease RecJ [Ignavibacteriota bacterium]MCW5883718.1 single-stranded-DNA-specific exonuclease RecJ [Candidatus Kapabacteria bacterium]
MLNYRWTIRPYNDEETVQNLAKTLNIPKSLAQVLASRGHISKNDAETFFKPLLESLHDPYIMEDMEKAVERILEAVKKQELIWVHGDYDVDGTASTAMVCQFISSIGGRVDYYIPDRFEDGYGLSNKSIDLALARNAKILLTVDVGITSYEQLIYANEKGLVTIICDHHEPGEQEPLAYAILDPLKPGCPYPFKSLAACGVAFKLVQAVCMRLGMLEKSYQYLDYVAISSAADMVPLKGENRILVHYGLKQLNKNPRPGINGLIHCTGLRLGNITASNIVYAVAPLINAAGRLGDAKRSVEMMMQNDENAAFRIAQVLEDENRKRRLFDQKAFEEAIPMAKKMIETNSPHSLVVYGENWHAGVIGIVASRLVDKFNLPSVLLTNIEGVAKGSARSINDFDIHSALKQCDDILLEYGGHKHAAGLSLKIEHIDEFRHRLDELAKKAITIEMLLPEIVVDSELQFNELSPHFLHNLSRFAPYGYANYKPIFVSKGVKSVNGIKVVGNNNIRFRAIQNNFVIDAIGQNLASKVNLCNNGKKFSMVYNLELTSLNGAKTPQLIIKDIKPDSN